MRAIDSQRDHWQKAYEADRTMYGSVASEAVTFAIRAFAGDEVGKVLGARSRTRIGTRWPC